MAKYCTHCGKKIGEQATFCKYCGEKVKTFDTTIESAANGSKISDNKGKAPKGMIIVISVAVGLALITAIVGAILFLGGPDSKASKNDAIEYSGHHYKLVNEPLYWTEAKAACEEAGGHLVTITSEGEQNFIVDLIEKEGVKKHYWLGGTDEKTERDWEWITNEDMTYTNWCVDQPNNNDDDDPSGQDYMEIQVTRGDQGNREYMTWNDICNTGISHVNGVSHEEAPDYCSTKYFGYICEWD